MRRFPPPPDRAMTMLPIVTIHAQAHLLAMSHR